MFRLIALLFVVCCLPVQARLGETLAQCEERYGPVVERKPAHLPTSDKDSCIFSRNGITIHVEFKSGIAWRIVYKMVSFDPDSLAQLLVANALEGGWSKLLQIGDKEVRAAPGRERLAVFTPGKKTKDYSILEVVTAEYTKANRAAYEAKMSDVPELVKQRLTKQVTKDL